MSSSSQNIESLVSAFRKLSEEKAKWEQRVNQVVKLVAQVECFRKDGASVPVNIRFFDWSIVFRNSGGIEILVEWEDSWRYGGHDEGEFYFPIRLLNKGEAERWHSEEMAKLTEDSRV